MVLNKLESLDDYAQYLRENAAEIEALHQDILINVTSFFRDPETFAVLRERIFPQLMQHRAPGEPLRVWTLGCSTGEEAYSIAISFAEFAGDQANHVPIQIFATDLSEQGIERARTGFYSKDITETVSPERLRRFFTEAEGGYRVCKPIRDMVVFARQNVLADPPFSRLDLISCRNLLIYLEPVLQKQVLPALHYALKPEGILWLGSSETVGAASDLFTPQDKKHKFYSKKPAAARWHLPSVRGDAAGQKTGSGQQTNYVNGQLRGEHDVQKEADRILLARYSPAGVLVNAEMEILQFRGSTGAYLEPPAGKVTLNLLKMAREGLMLSLRAAIQKAKKDDATIRKEGVLVSYDGESHEVNLEVIPVKSLAADERCFLVLFEPAAGGRRRSRSPNVREDVSKQEGAGRRVARLQEELAVTREYMQSLVEQHEAANEELQASSEEIQSSNEELQSVNEELETAKEELESSNEELLTLNDELGNRNQELTTLNADLNNLHSSVNLPILILDSQLRIRRFTRAAEKGLNLISTDVGRPIGDIKSNLSFPELEKLIVEVIDTVSAREREVQDRQGHWHSLRVRPYKTLDNRIDGAVVVLVDIDALKRGEAEISAARDYAEAIIETVREPLIVLDENLRVRTANRAFYDDFQVTLEDTENRLLYELGSRQWDIPALRTMLEEILSENSQFQDFEVEHEFEGIGRKTMLLNARRLAQEGGRTQLILLAIEDITQRKQAGDELRTSEEFSRTVLESSPDCVKIVDEAGRLQYMNANGLCLTEIDDFTSFKNEFWWNLWTEETQPVVKESVARALRGETAQFQAFCPTAKGTPKWWDVIVSPIAGAAGKPARLISVSRDITERKQAEEEREQLLTSEHQARVQADEANRLKDEFLATVSHELRTPLTAIMGWANMLQDGRLDEETAVRAVETIARNAQAQNHIIADLLDVSRIISGKLRFEQGAVELIPIIEAALEVVRPAAEAKGVELRPTLHPTVGLVSGDADRLQQIVWNLLANAVKYTRRGGHIEARLEREDTHVSIIVRDTGEGISPEVLPFIFDRFRQADGSTTRQHGGLGLGLAIVRQLVEAHGGTVRAASHGEGQGATFTVTLPVLPLRNSSIADGGLRKTDFKPEQVAVRNPPSAILTGLRVLMVDDEPDARELLTLALMQGGAEVRSAASVAEALKTMDQWTPDVLVSDIGMPSKDGYDLIQQVRAREPERGGLLPALALTGYASVADAKRALTAGFQRHIPKPIDLAELIAVIADLGGQSTIDDA